MIKEEDIILIRINKEKQKERYRFHRHIESIKLLHRKKRIMNRRDMSEERFNELYHKDWFTLKNHGKEYYPKNYHHKLWKKLWKERERNKDRRYEYKVAKLNSEE